MQEMNLAEIEMTNGGLAWVLVGVLLAEIAAIEQIDDMIRGFLEGFNG